MTSKHLKTVLFSAICPAETEYKTQVKWPLIISIYQAVTIIAIGRQVICRAIFFEDYTPEEIGYYNYSHVENGNQTAT